MVEKSADYALIMHHALRHVGMKLEGAAPAALSFSDLTKDYEHPNPSDLSRVRRHESTHDDNAAKAWVIRYAVSLLDGGLAVDGERVSFAPGKGFDDLKWSGGKVERPGPDPNPLFHDAFSPITGQFAANIREEIGDLSELRDSMAKWGWLSEFPALVDERDVVLVGNRRMKVAKELGLDPVIRRLTLGFGDAADAVRFKLAIASNIGAKRLSPNDRKRLAAYLYQDHEWSMERIAEALNVATKTISRDLSDFDIMSNSKKGRPRKEKVRKAPDEKQVARSINTRSGEWEQFKEKAEAQGYSAAAKLGELVRQDIHDQLRAEVAEHLCTCPVCGNQHRREPQS